MITTERSVKPLIEVWKILLQIVMDCGDDSDAEIKEIRNVTTNFTVGPSDFSKLMEYDLNETLSEMRKVFFTTEPNRFGHSYRYCWRGPFGKDDLSDVIGVLKDQPRTKRALLAFVDLSGRKVPCINSIHFIIRRGCLDMSYFARGQDIYLKFCADAICVHDFGTIVSEALGIKIGTINGTISSAHIYRKDFEKVELILQQRSI